MKRITITLLAAILLTLALAGTAQAAAVVKGSLTTTSATVIDHDQQYKSWALKWQVRAMQDRAELVSVARQSGITLRIPPVFAEQFIVWTPLRPGVKQVGVMYWHRFGKACRASSLRWDRFAEGLR